MTKSDEIEKLKKSVLKEQQINRILSSEIKELKAINVDLRSAYDSYLTTYKNYISYIDKFRKTILFRFFRKIKNKIRREKLEILTLKMD